MPTVSCVYACLLQNRIVELIYHSTLKPNKALATSPSHTKRQKGDPSPAGWYTGNHPNNPSIKPNTPVTDALSCL